jgi:predicted lipoprotein with Yx(FWY)xxD motif
MDTAGPEKYDDSPKDRGQNKKWAIGPPREAARKADPMDLHDIVKRCPSARVWQRAGQPVQTWCIDVVLTDESTGIAEIVRICPHRAQAANA